MKHLKILLASVYVFLLSFSIMWISRTKDVIHNEAKQGTELKTLYFAYEKLDLLFKENPQLASEIGHDAETD